MIFARRFVRPLGFVVIPLILTGISAAQTSVTLALATSPSSAQPGASTVSVSGTGFPSGTIGPTDVTVTLAIASGGSGPTGASTVATQATVSGGIGRIGFVIPPSLQVSTATKYLVSISGKTSGGTFQSKNTSTLTILPPAGITSLSSSSGLQGQSLSITITGSGTHFGSLTKANFGPGISVGGAASGTFGPISSTNSTTAVAQITIQSSASVGGRNVTVQTGAESPTATNAFAVQASSTAPTANAGGPYKGDVGQTITFTGTGMGSGTLTATWNFGDGSPSVSGMTVTHAYSTANVYAATFSITDGTSQTAQSTAQVTVSNLPNASINTTLSPADVGQTITFTGNAVGASPLSFQWNFGDSVTATGSPVNHSYAGPNNYTIMLTVTDGNGISTKANTTLGIFNPPLANAGGPYNGDAGAPIVFNGSATGGAGTLLYAWNFGDGNSATGASPTHTYASAGPYTATLTVTDIANGTNKQTAGVTIAAALSANPGGPYSGIAGAAINFTASTTGGTGTDVYFWNWGDGTTSTGNPTTHTFSTGGDFKASLMVTDGVNASTTVAFDVNLKQDTTAPAVAINSPAALTLFNAGSNGVATVVVSAQDPDDAGSALTVKVNGIVASLNSDGTFTAQNVPLREGPNTLTATATDAAGNASTASISVGLDTTPPVVTITMPSNGAMLVTESTNVIGNVNDAVSGVVNQAQVTVQVNGVDAKVTNGTFSVPDIGLTPGMNTITATATDKAGNQSSAQVKVNVQAASGQQHLIIQGGNNESAAIQSTIPDPLLVQLVDANGGAIVNRAVTFTVTRGDGMLNPQQQNLQTLTLNTDNNGQASVIYQLGTRVGVGVNQVTVTSEGAAGEVILSETSTVGSPVVANVVSGDQQSGAVGQQLSNPLVAILLDVGGNPVPNVPITFTVTQGGGSVMTQGSTTGGASTAKVNSDSDGKAAVLLTLGAQEGTNNDVVTATFAGSQASAATFSASGLQPGSDSSQTSVGGVVLDNANTPIEGVTVSLVGTGLSTTTDSQGQFSISGAPVGTVSLLVNGATANSQGKTYPVLNFQLTTVAGRNNTLGMPIFLPVIDVDSSQVIGGDNNVILQMKGVPGYQFKIFARSATFPDGSHTGSMSLSQVHVDKVPMLPPNGTAPQIAGTLQPPGVVFNPPVQVQFPNTGGLAPGTVVTLYTYDHDIEQFISQGPAHVSADGSVIVSDPGFGITKSGWHFAPPPPPPHTCTVSCPTNDPCNTYTQVDCACQKTPVADETPCGTPLSDNKSCQLPGICVDGFCTGTDKPLGTPCDDGLFCTKDKECVGDTCLALGKKEDTSVQENYQYGGLNAVYSAVKGFLGKFGASQYMPDIEVVGQITRTSHCCEEKMTTVANIQSSAGVSVGLQTPDIPVPGLAGDLHLPLVGDIKAGLFFQAAGAIVAQIMDTQTPCDTPCDCAGGSLGLQLTATLLLEAQIPNPALKTGCGLKGQDQCNLAKVFLMGQTGLNFGAQVDCQSLTVGVDWPGVSFGGGVTLLEGTFLQEQLTFTYQPSWGQPQHLYTATFMPVPWATGGSACQ